MHKHIAWARRLSADHSVCVTELRKFPYKDASWSLGLGISCSDFKRRQPLSVCSRDDNLSRHTEKLSLCAVAFFVLVILCTVCAARRLDRVTCTSGRDRGAIR